MGSIRSQPCWLERIVATIRSSVRVWVNSETSGTTMANGWEVEILID